MKRVFWVRLIGAICLFVAVGLLFTERGGAALGARAEGDLPVLTIGGDVYPVRVEPSPSSLAAGRYGSCRAYVAEAWNRGATLAQIGDSLSPEMGTALVRVLARYETPPVDAEVLVGKDGLTYSPSREGLLFDPEEVAFALASALDGETPSPLVPRPVPARVTLEEVRHCTRLLGQFRTFYATDAKERSHNLRLAAEAINARVLPAGATFSFNEIVGERTPSRGYQSAPSIRDGRYVPSVGGGVCQASTTVYNAALLAGLPCSGRRHSLPVHYVEPSRDAMVSEWSDMTFRNVTPYPMYLFAKASGGVFEVRLYGYAVAESVRLYSEVLAETAPRNVDEAGNELTDLSGYVLLSEGSKGLKARLVRVLDGKREVLRQDVYPARDAVWREG